MTRHMLFIPVEGATRMIAAETYEEMRIIIGADVGIERVRVGIDWALCVDGDGAVRGKPVNPRASILYGSLMHGTHVHGDALLAREEFVATEDITTSGVDWVDTSEDEARSFLADREAE